MIVICIVISLTIVSAVNYFKSRRKRALIKNLSGPLAMPLIGSVQKFLLLTPKNFLSKSREYLNQFGTFSRCWVFDRLFILTADYEFVTQLLNSADHLNTGYNNLLQPVYGDGVFRRDNQEWQQRRQLITHALRPEALTDFAEVFTAQAQVLIERLRGECDGKSSFNIQPYVERAILDVLLATAVGVEGKAQVELTKSADSGAAYAEAVLALIQLFTSRFLSLHSANATIYSILCPLQKRRQKRLLQTINRINHEVIAEQRAAASTTAVDKSNGAMYTIQVHESRVEAAQAQQQRDTLLKALLAANIAGESLNNAEICDELNTFTFQGCLLTPAAISFALVMISRQPSVQQKVLEELLRVWPKGVSRDFTVENLMKLKYLECVINETLRLYPPQPIIARDLKRNFNYTHSRLKDAVLPAESEIYINIFEILRQSECFTDPECFRPERFSPVDAAENTEMLAWGLGPRNCLAQRYTMVLMKSVIAQLLLAYEVLPFGEELCLEVKIVLSSSSGWQLALKERDY
ncbi:probable cytochrome P450 316a1 [Rhagoletis pomonella]|uniref:probable cytochrome P450 316a1 n=1 Tax=Rhagoletis pomonella TaxID=28610 RepID=UPI00177B5E9C|nr:probable cytochrome P450 316a1 [Rhagoletis pomonella]